MTMNLSLSHDLGEGPNKMQAGFRVSNLFGNYTDAVVGGNSRYRNNGLGGYNSAPGSFAPFPSGSNLINPTYEPYQYPRSPLPFENEPTGGPRLWTFFVTSYF